MPAVHHADHERAGAGVVGLRDARGDDDVTAARVGGAKHCKASAYAPDQVEVEFVNAAGHTEALVTLATDAIRPVSHHDLIAVRHVPESKSLPE